MTMLRGVLDANMVIGLVKGGVFNLLPSLYAPLYIPVGACCSGQSTPARSRSRLRAAGSSTRVVSVSFKASRIR